MQETIASAVYDALQRVEVTTDEDRANFQEAYGYPVGEHLDEVDIGGFDDDSLDLDYEPVVPTLGYEVGGENADLASLITEALLVEGDVSQDDGRKVYGAVLESLNDFPKKRINGREQNYFVGGPQEFAEVVAEKVEAALSKRGILGKVASFLKLRK